ncbi:MAG: hypothetical protein M0R33_17755 [Methylomonas sp.]|uniref:hypothetical protein n=1 Tax=Methylomonas sp. TaxID=418 RepID=UPI0025F79612|nr:hypothetical protein [Methylomonas sp.]MCK9608293.1 hypothetical protein [Methylomonas sp.]
MSKKLMLCGTLFSIGFAVFQTANAASINLTPSSTTVLFSNTVQVAVLADIDVSESIIGFGFDLSLSSGGVLDFVGFTPGGLFADDLLNLAPFSDSDGIRGASNGDLFFGPAISGSGILLGTLDLKAIGLGTATIDLLADDLNFFFTEGLIPEDPGLVNFIPPVTNASITVVANNNIPEPPLGMLIGVGVAAMMRSLPRQRNRLSIG